MKFFAPILFLICFLRVSGQPDFSRLDSIAAAFEEPILEVEEFTQKLTGPFDTDLEKARVIFMWIAHHIRYDCKKYHEGGKVPRFTGRTPEEVEKKAASWRKQEAERLLKYKRGICADYSRLFLTMGRAAGLEVEYITGDARDFHKPYKKAHDNPHAWNAVKIEGKWHLLDATWAAGHVDAEVTKFTRKVSPGYFITPPAWFVQNHWPDDPKWQLLETPLNPAEFASQPIINYGQMNFPLLDFSPKVKAVPGNDNRLEIRLKFHNTPKAFIVSAGKSKPIDFEATQEDGYTLLRFSGKGVRDVIVYGGESARRRMEWLAKYNVE